MRVEDSDYFYSNMLRAFLRMVETGEQPFPPEETLKIMRTLVSARRSPCPRRRKPESEVPKL